MAATSRDITRVLEFLRCPTPVAWIEAALADVGTLLLDHAALELKAAQQAQKLIWRYGLSRAGGARGRPGPQFRARLLRKMSRLAREELRHFERVAALLEKREIPLSAVPASRYAASLHDRVRREEPGRLVDTLIVAAIIEARSCERFHALQGRLRETEPEIAGLYRALLDAESRHFGDYLELAELAAEGPIAPDTDRLLELERELVESSDCQLAFHSGVPANAPMVGMR